MDPRRQEAAAGVRLPVRPGRVLRGLRARPVWLVPGAGHGGPRRGLHRQARPAAVAVQGVAAARAGVPLRAAAEGRRGPVARAEARTVGAARRRARGRSTCFDPGSDRAVRAGTEQRSEHRARRCSEQSRVPCSEQTAPVLGRAERHRSIRIAVAEVQQQNSSWFASDLMWEIQAALPALHPDADSTALMQLCLTRGPRQRGRGCGDRLAGQAAGHHRRLCPGRAGPGRPVGLPGPGPAAVLHAGPPRRRAVPAVGRRLAVAAEDDQRRGV